MTARDLASMAAVDLKSPTDIFRVLDRSNCKQCNEPTCLAFAARVFRGERELSDCPKLDRDVGEKFRGHLSNSPDSENSLERKVMALRSQIATLDFTSIAQRTGATVSGNRITIRVLGKEFSVDSQGNLYSDIHVHPWVTVPILSYLIDCRGVSPTGTWVPLKELPGGNIWHRLFEQRCEKPLRRIADKYTRLFEDMIHVFNGRRLANASDADVELVLHPLPKIPMLIRYWETEEGLDSALNVFFDARVEENLNIESIFALGTGLVRMLEKISLRHG